MKLANLSPNAVMDAENPRGGINLHFDLDVTAGATITDSWLIAGWQLRFVRLAPHQTLELDHAPHYAKVILGRVENLGRSCFAEDFMVRTTRLDTTQVLAGSQGLLFALFTDTGQRPSNLQVMSECVFSGPLADRLEWKSFRERFGGFTDYFDELDNHMAAGFHLLDQQGIEICYVNFWTCGKAGDVSTHNHGHAPSAAAPAFAEVHLVLENGTGHGGMYEAPGPGEGERIHHPMQPGDEHGPFFEHRDGHPLLLENGAVKYPWHGWQSGTNALSAQCYDLVAAFEINPDFALIGPGRLQVTG